MKAILSNMETMTATSFLRSSSVEVAVCGNISILFSNSLEREGESDCHFKSGTLAIY